MECSVVNAVAENFKAMCSLGVRATVYCAISLHRICGYILNASTLGIHSGRHFRIFDHNDMKLDAVVIPESLDLDNPSEVAGSLRPIFDHLWIDMGYGRPRNFDDAGNWTVAMQ